MITCLEALFNTGRSELRQRVSRSVAVLLGRDYEDSEYIYNSVKFAYDVRSKVVHTGVTKDIRKVWDWHLRQTVSTAIRRCWELDIDKQDLVKRLNTFGFGDGDTLRPKANWNL